MTRRHSILSISVLMAIAVSLRAQQADPIAEKLSVAKAAYQTATDKLHSDVLSALRKREDDARKGGQAKVLDTTRSEREAFEKKGTVPKWLNPDGFIRAHRTARGILLAEYDAAIAAYAKDPAQDPARTRIMKERDEMIAEQTGDVVGSFRKGTIWKGTVKAKSGTNVEYELEIATYNGVEFEGTFRSKDGNTNKPVKGTLVRGRLEWTLGENRTYRQMSGAKAAGMVRGDVLEVVMTNTYAKRPYEWTVSLRLSK